MSDLQPLKWHDTEYSAGIAKDAQGAAVYYRAIERDGKHVVYWMDNVGGSDGDKTFSSFDELKEWVEAEHYPHKMQPYVKPSPTWIDVDKQSPEKNTTVLVVYHAHFDDEEVTEFDVCTAFFDGETFDTKDQLFYQKRNTTVVRWMPIPDFSEVTNA